MTRETNFQTNSDFDFDDDPESFAEEFCLSTDPDLLPYWNQMLREQGKESAHK